MNKVAMDEYKEQILLIMARAGISPSEVGRAVKRAAAFGPQGLQKDASWLGDTLTKVPALGEKIVGHLGGALLASMLLSGGVGVAGGYAAEQMFGTGEQDVKNYRDEQRIRAIRRATDRQRSELEAKQLVSQEDDDDKKRRRGSTLSIQTSV